MTEPLFYPQLMTEQGWLEFQGGIQVRVSNDKFLKVMSFFSYPLPITSISQDILDDLNRVWSARNASFHIQYPNKRAEATLQDTILKLDTRNFVEKVGRKAFQCAPQTIVVVDKDENGEPYYISVGLDKLIDFECEHGKFKWIEFVHSEKYVDDREIYMVAHYDAESYKVYEVDGKIKNLVIDNPHNLGYCPARWFIDEPLSMTDDEKRFNFIASVLGVMSEWQQFYAYSFYAEHYSTFPVVEYAAASCENDYCQGGMISYPLENGGLSKPEPCPTCSSNKFNGAGTAIKVNPAIEKDENDARGYFRFISPPTQNLEFESQMQLKRENFIKVKTTGYNDVLNKEAVNDTQVRSLVEDRRKPLLRMSGIVSRLHKWLVETAVKVSNDIDIKVEANYGTEWFLLTEEQIQALFTGAKAAGLPEGELNQIYNLLIETKYKTQPRIARKLIIENALNPAPYNTLEECYAKAQNGVMNREDLYIKANFVKFVNRFERENGSIIDFGSDLSFDQKINAILQTFKNYVNEEQENRASESELVQQ